MELQAWLSSGIDSLQSSSVVCCTGDSYPLLFFSTLSRILNKKQPGSMVSINHTNDVVAIQAGLQSSFLGQTGCYILGSLDDLPRAKQEQWKTFLKSYQGPHTVLFFSNKLSSFSSHWTRVEVPSVLNFVTAQSLATEYAPQLQKQFLDDLYMYTNGVSLDTFMVLLQYGMLVGKNSKQFFMDFLPKLVVSESSLFSLSQAWFGKQPRQFYRQWNKVRLSYSSQFWIVYWSEQLWRAACFVDLQNNKKPLEAKKVSYRLPFSFINRDWSRYTRAELIAAHNQLYDIDFQSKNGGSDVWIDWFLSRFLLDAFKIKKS